MPATELSALLPLEPPPLPPAPWWGELLPLAAVVLAILGLWWWWRRPASRHARRLNALQRRLTQPDCDTRAIAAHLAQLLRDASSNAQHAAPSAHPALAAVDRQRLLTALQQARFRRQAPTPAELDTLLPLARQVIRGGHA
jgi:hypothetical protein